MCDSTPVTTTTIRLLLAACFLFAACVGRAAVADLVLEKAESWAPRAEATPIVSESKGGEIAISGNGTRLCSGGWQYVFSGVRGGEA